MKQGKLDTIVFYQIEKTIKIYRQFAQKNISAKGIDITIDQWLILKTIEENKNCSQQEIAEHVFKDVASVTRIIEILVKKEFLIRKMHSEDRRRYYLILTSKGKNVLKKLIPVIEQNRASALLGVVDNEIKNLSKILTKISTNCL